MIEVPDLKPDPEEQVLIDDLISTYEEGKDELNLAEFPIASLSRQIDPSVKTITFEDTVWDKASRQLIKRKLTITGSDEYGLPNATDDEVILGLIQLSRLQGFGSKGVKFTRYQLLKILGWKDTTYNYKRLEESMNRWLGVTLYYDNAWRDKSSGEWVTTAFHFINNVEIYRNGKTFTHAGEGYSYFQWNDVIFDSLKAGNLKSIDFGILRSIEGPSTKRLYRFLDKRFYQSNTLSFEVRKFACNKVGLSDQYTDISQIKRKLRAAIMELERVGYIEPESESTRFTKTPGGEWEVHFAKCTSKTKSLKADDNSAISRLEERILAHGVTSRQARLLMSEFPPEFISEKIDILDFLLNSGGNAVPANPAGYLVRSIRENWPRPAGFRSSQEQQQELELQLARKEKIRQMKETRKFQEDVELRKQEEEAARMAAIAAKYLDGLSKEQQEEVTQLATERFNGYPMTELFKRNLVTNYVIENLI
ncbi:MAG: replication initiator protein A [Verrucomicrobiota bacterium]